MLPYRSILTPPYLLLTDPPFSSDCSFRLCLDIKKVLTGTVSTQPWSNVRDALPNKRATEHNSWTSNRMEKRTRKLGMGRRGKQTLVDGTRSPLKVRRTMQHSSMLDIQASLYEWASLMRRLAMFFYDSLKVVERLSAEPPHHVFPLPVISWLAADDEHCCPQASMRRVTPS